MKVPSKTSSGNLPKIQILNKLRKKKVSRKVKSSVKMTPKVQILPWVSQHEWDTACDLFTTDNTQEMMEKLLIWQARVPSLPVGVEGTLFIIQALLFDGQCDEFSPSQTLQARSLYSLALIRFMNHMSHVATQAIGGMGRPMFELAEHLSIPTWLVDLRHEATHGGNLPSLAALREASVFIKSWLTENYWIPSSKAGTMSSNTNLELPEPPAQETGDETEQVPEHETIFSSASEVISGYVACRVYFLRDSPTVTDPDVTTLWPDHPKSIPIKEALRGLKNSIDQFLSKSPSLTCAALVQELIPDPEFFRDFSCLFGDGSTNPRSKLFLVWSPILKLATRKRRLVGLCEEMAKIHVSPDSSQHTVCWSAIWLKKLLLVVIQSGEDYSAELVSRVVPIALKKPNPYSELFLKRLFRLAKPALGASNLKKLQELTDIWTEPLDFDGPPTMGLAKELVTLEDVVEVQRQRDDSGMGVVTSTTDPEFPPRLPDDRDTQFWQEIPLGHVF